MEKAVQDYLSSNSSGSLVTDSNGLLMSGKELSSSSPSEKMLIRNLPPFLIAHGTLRDKSHLAGRISAISRQSQLLFQNGANNVNVIVHLSNDEQIIVKKVGNLTVAVNEGK
jgi:hypothetical protein